MHGDAMSCAEYRCKREGNTVDMDQDGQRARLRARRIFLQERSAALALRARVFPKRFRRAEARKNYYLSTYNKR